MDYLLANFISQKTNVYSTLIRFSVSPEVDQQLILFFNFFMTLLTGPGPMPEHYRNVLRIKRVDLVNDLLVDDVLNYLFEKLVFDSDHLQLIHAEKTDKRKAEKLLDLLPKRGERAFGHFLDALRDPYPHLYEILIQYTKESPRGMSSTAASLDTGTVKVPSNNGKKWALVRKKER